MLSSWSGWFPIRRASLGLLGMLVSAGVMAWMVSSYLGQGLGPAADQEAGEQAAGEGDSGRNSPPPLLDAPRLLRENVCEHVCTGATRTCLGVALDEAERGRCAEEEAGCRKSCLQTAATGDPMGRTDRKQGGPDGESPRNFANYLMGFAPP